MRNNFKTCCITDHGNCSGAISFIKALAGVCNCGHQKSGHAPSTGKCSQKNCSCTKFERYGVKPIIGNEFYLSRESAKVKTKENRKLAHLCVLAKNLSGWKALIKATSESNRPENFYYRPRLALSELAKFADGNLLCFSGHPGSQLADILFENPSLAYSSRSVDAVKKRLKANALEEAIQLARQYENYFGKGNFDVEIQLIDRENFPAAEVIAEILREVSKQTGIPALATADSHYPTREDAVDQRILLCTAFRTTLANVEEKIANDEDVSLAGFFRSNNYHIPSQEDMAANHTDEELQNSLKIAEACEDYSVLSKPIIPKFACPDGTNANDYLRELCRHGWKKKIQTKIPHGEQGKYVDRVKHELAVITNAGLSDYFLIIQDIINDAKSHGELCGIGRGSAAGSIVSYLADITDVDPIKYNLLFERFYNAARSSSLPDIDCDFQTSKRAERLNYIKEKYGRDKVGQMITFGRMQGRSALSDVLRAHSIGSHAEWKEITEHIPDEAAISDQLQVMREEEGEASIIKWALENNAKQLQQWCYIDDNGELAGDYAKYFAQAIRLEGTIRSQGKHAAGVIISNSPLDEICPRVYDKKSDEMLCGVDMHDAEAIGQVKIDVLGTTVLDKISGVFSLLKTGKIVG